LQRLPADKLLALLALVEEAVGIEQATVAPAKRVELPPEPMTIEAEAEPEPEEVW